MNVTYYGHSCFLVEVLGKRLLFDPYIQANHLASKVNINCICPDYIFLSHGHIDHVADVQKITSKHPSCIIANYEVINWLENKYGITSSHSMNVGGNYDFDFGKVTLTHAIHSSMMPDGSYGGVAGGFCINTDDGSFYYSGDTGLMEGMNNIKKLGPFRFLVLCIGGNFTMNFHDAADVAQIIGCENILGVHYDTFPTIKIQQEVAKKYFTSLGLKLHLLPINSSYCF